MEKGRTTKKILQRLVCHYSHHQIPSTLPSLHKPTRNQEGYRGIFLPHILKVAPKIVRL